MTRALLTTLLVLTTTAAQAQDEEQLREENRLLRKNLDAERRRVKEQSLELGALRKLVHGEPYRPVKVDHLRRTLLANAHVKITELVDLKSLQLLEPNPSLMNVGEWRRFVFELERVVKRARKPYRDLATLTRDALLTIRLLPFLRAFERQGLRYAESRLKAAYQDKKRLEKDIDYLRQKNTQLDDQLLDQARKYESERHKLLQEKETIQREFRVAIRDHKLDMARMQSQRSRLETRLREVVRIFRAELGSLSQRLMRTIDRQVLDLDLSNLHPRDALGQLSQLTGIRHVIDHQTLARVGKRRVNLNAKRIPLPKALDHIAQQLGLKWKRGASFIRFRSR